MSQPVQRVPSDVAVDPTVRFIFEHMADNGIRIIDVEAASGVSRHTMASWKRGPRNSPKHQNVRAVVNALGFDLAVVPLEQSQ